MTKPKDYELIEVLVPCHDPMESAGKLHPEDLKGQPAQILRCLKALEDREDVKAYNDPTTRAWRDCDGWLAWHGVVYSTQVLTMGIEVPELAEIAQYYATATEHRPPAWWGDEFHQMQQAMLFRRRPDDYTAPEDPDMRVIFPGAENRAFREHREVVTLSREADRLQEQASRARQASEDARRRALENEVIVDEARREQKAKVFSNNGWTNRS